MFKSQWKLENLPNLTALFFVIFFEHCTFCKTVFKGTFFSSYLVL
jgi:hypothetical protein